MYLATELLRELEKSDLSRSDRALLRCELARRQEQAGDYDAASEAMAELWKGVGVRPNLEGLDDQTKAEVLFACRRTHRMDRERESDRRFAGNGERPD